MTRNLLTCLGGCSTIGMKPGKEMGQMKVQEEYRRCKQLVYALHDVGAEMDAAKLYFDMYGDRSLPSVKWLAKVCADEDAKRFVRSKFEEMGDLATFESIFVDDGYERRDRKKSVRRR